MKNKEKGAEKNTTNELKESSGWTPERRRLQAERIRQRKPWLHSTGPRTAAGKAVSSRNALVHGMRSRARRVLCYLLRVQRDFVRNLNAFGVAHSPFLSLPRPEIDGTLAPTPLPVYSFAAIQHGRTSSC